MRETFLARTRSIERELRQVHLEVSFRSTKAVLDAVDWVFAGPEAAKGVADAGEVVHITSRDGQPGRVELWPVIEAQASEADTADLSPQSDNATAPHERLARLIAVHAKGLIGKERRASTGELLNAGHFMVLVRRRNAFVRALVKELKRAEIDVAGVDRLNLGEELAIQDLLALARFVLLPQDDLNLACLLKSPLIGLDEQALFELAHGRKGHLWGALRSRSKVPRFASAYAQLATWLARADFTTPFDFFAEALGPEGGRVRLLERLGKEAADPIDELLSRALHYQRAETGSLQGFLRWFEAGGGEIKRDLDANRRPEVRILTVHAAKGLQAPIVYLPDTTRVPRGSEPTVSRRGRRVTALAPTRQRCQQRGARLAPARAGARARGAKSPALRRHDPRRGPALYRRMGRRDQAGCGLLARAHRRRPAASVDPAEATSRRADSPASRRTDIRFHIEHW